MRYPAYEKLEIIRLVEKSREHFVSLDLRTIGRI